MILFRFLYLPLITTLKRIESFIIFSALLQTRTDIRNPWAHCNFQEWDETKYEACFETLNKLIRSLKLLKERETETTEKLDDLKTHGKYE